MQINKYVAALVLMFGLSAPAIAAECEYGTVERLETIYAETQKIYPDMVRKTLTDREVQQIIDAVGRPPNAKEGVISVERIDIDGTTVLVFTQDGCFINKIGPIPTDLMNMQFGGTSAKGEKVD